ncbi:MAG: ImmA/IrrE family metallo-endopeptidase [Candidatus Omnitrophica bacterium]|nr:ImmA/IrrE family metallo-endopeptidase [Candidatus Omnitrophota bacterium]
MKLDIIPIPGLHRAFDVDGFLSSDRKSISIDEGVYQSRPGRYRFTLAHEIGHLVLHKDIYERYEFENVAEWKEFINKFPEKEYSWFEWQAYEFAGLVLVPPAHLNKRVIYHTKEIKSLGIQNKDVINDRVTELLSEDFVVSRDVIQRRLTKEAKKSEG